MEKTNYMKIIEQIHGKPLETLLIDLYFNEKLNQHEIANQLNVSVGSVNRWFRILNIPTKKIEFDIGGGENS